MSGHDAPQQIAGLSAEGRPRRVGHAPDGRPPALTRIQTSNQTRGLFHKEMISIWREPAMLMPMLLLPLLFSCGLPALILTVGVDGGVGNVIAGAQGFLNHNVQPPGTSFGSQEADATWALLQYFFAPIFLLLPVIFATTVASYSFAGEKVENTLEGLLNAPVTVRQIAFVKMLASALPSTVASWVSVCLYIAVVNIAGHSLFGRVVLVNAQWAMVLVLVPLIAFLAVGLVVLVSQRARSVKSAQSVAMIGVLPVVGSMISQAAGAFLLGTAVLVVLAGVLVVLDAVILWLVGTVSSDRLLLQ